MAIKTTANSFSVGTGIQNETIMLAKDYLKQEFGNKYDAEPHIAFHIMAMPDYRIKDLEKICDEYFKKIKPIRLQLGNLRYDDVYRFFSIPIVGNEILTLHKELIETFNPIRDGYIRAKDLENMNSGKTDEIEEEYIYKYGYLRVLSKYTPHITIGDIATDNFNSDDVQKKLNSILSNLYGTALYVNELQAHYMEESGSQSNYKWLWKKSYKLN